MFVKILAMKTLKFVLLILFSTLALTACKDDDSDTNTPDEDPNAANQTAADAIKNYINTQGLDTSNLTVAFDGASRTVTLSVNCARASS